MNKPLRGLVLLTALALGAPLLAAEPDEWKFDVPPRPVQQSAPEYPFALRAAGVEGRVTLRFILGVDGRVEEVFVAKSNNPWFERPAMDAVLKWRFTPAQRAGRPVRARVQQEVRFHLNGMRGEDYWFIEKGPDHAKLPPELQWHTPPVPESTTMAVYPFEALVAGKKGQAKVTIIIDDKGRVAQARLIAADQPEFGAALLAMVDGWRFKPARRADGTPCGAAVSFQRDFAPLGKEVPVAPSAHRILRKLADKNPGFTRVDELDAPLKPISRRPPIYPTTLRQSGIEGHATIEFFLDAEGDAQLPRIVDATAPEFGYAAAQAVATWRFAPPRRGGKEAIVRVQQRIDFSLQEPKPRPAQPDAKIP